MPVPIRPGMQTQLGRVVEVTGDHATVWDAATHQPATVLVTECDPDLSDRVTFLMALDVVAERTALDVPGGFIWFYDPQSVQWVLEGAEETRTREGDTEDPVEALRRALDETEP